jgi:hypothetical protein
MPSTPVPASAEGLPDLEDQINRVRWMSQMAWDLLRECHDDDLPAEREKISHLVRATQELAESLWHQFYGRAAA